MYKIFDCSESINHHPGLILGEEMGDNRLIYAVLDSSGRALAWCSFKHEAETIVKALILLKSS